jgi:type I restriction enzyme S subunit
MSLHKEVKTDAEAQRAIALLQERRTALISAAVTGQIDVREETT